MKPITQFIGRKTELTRLNSFLSKRSASLIVVRGRRRIGKSRLLKEFGKQMKSFFLSGLPPKLKTKITNAAQKLELIRSDLSAEENLRDICFTRGGLLVREFEQIFSDLFFRRSKNYKEIIECLEEDTRLPN